MSTWSNGTIGNFGGLRVIEPDALPIAPSAGAVGKRIVRHGMADVLAWLGEDVGPRPEDETHALIIGGSLHASAAIIGMLKDDVRHAQPSPSS